MKNKYIKNKKYLIGLLILVVIVSGVQIYKIYLSKNNEKKSKEDTYTGEFADLSPEEREIMEEQRNFETDLDSEQEIKNDREILEGVG